MKKGVEGSRVYYLGLSKSPTHTSALRLVTSAPVFGSELRGAFKPCMGLRATCVSNAPDFASYRSTYPSFLGLGGVFSLSSVGFERMTAVTTLPVRCLLPASLALYGEKNKLRGLLLVSQAASTGTGYPGINQGVLTEISVTSVAAMFGYSRRYQRAHFLRLSFVRHLRRYLLALGQLEGSLGVIGTIRQFRSYFKALNSPTNQLFRHPLTAQYIADVSLVLPVSPSTSCLKSDLVRVVRDNLREHQVLMDESLLTPQPEGLVLDADSVVADLVSFF